MASVLCKIGHIESLIPGEQLRTGAAKHTSQATGRQFVLMAQILAEKCYKVSAGHLFSSSYSNVAAVRWRLVLRVLGEWFREA
jgi:hypothetical protein